MFAISLCFPVADTLAQDPIIIQHACTYDGEENEKEYYQFDPSAEADSIVEKICKAVGIAKNFTVKSSNIKNALATEVGTQRFILYSTAFLEKFKIDTLTTWGAYAVMAHEIGHHLNGHDFSEKDMSKRKRMELQADLFSGSVLRVLGANLIQAQAGIQLFALEGESASHPAASARREAIANGWKQSDERLKNTLPAPVRPTVPDSLSRALLSPVYKEITAFENQAKDILRFLLTARRIFNEDEEDETAYEYQEKMQNYMMSATAIESSNQAVSITFEKIYKDNPSAIVILDDWYDIALREIHERLMLPLDDLVELGQSDPDSRDIDGSLTESEKARQDFQKNWSPDGVLYKSLKENITKLELTRKKLAPFLKL
ncbi:MAG TPA: M48 family metalloprotease [Saprospiraceae bacterium]|nr:M48 family metalloprotease [Saprospiraceae bacterium]